jgi:hypothetical protein
VSDQRRSAWRVLSVVSSLVLGSSEVAPSRERRRALLYQSTHPITAYSTSAKVLNGLLRRTTSVVNNPMMDTASALSQASPTEPMEADKPLQRKGISDLHRRVSFATRHRRGG